jgi:hypothetical protein
VFKSGKRGCPVVPEGFLFLGIPLYKMKDENGKGFPSTEEGHIAVSRIDQEVDILRERVGLLRETHPTEVLMGVGNS